MTACVLSGFLFLFFAHIDRVTEFKAGPTGFEAKTRELDKAILTATDTIKELRSLALIVGKVTLSSAIRNGRVGPILTIDEIQELVKSVHAVFDELGLSEADKKSVMSEIETFTRFDYVLGITGNAVAPKLREKLPESQASTFEEEFRTFSNAPKKTPDELRTIFRAAGLLTDNVEDLIAEYEYYCKHGEHRNPQVYCSLQSDRRLIKR